MSAYEMTFSVDGRADASDVRIFLDSEPQGGLASERELPLRRSADNAWSGTFVVRGDRREGFIYRIGMKAEPGTVWSLEVRESGAAGRALLADSDTVVMPKEWLVGFCGC